MIKLLQKYYEHILLALLIIFSTSLYSFISFQKHTHFQTFAWDTTFFVQELYFVKQLQPPFTSLYEMNALGDHFQIAFLVFGGIGYFLWSDPKIIFLVQAIMVSLSAVPLYLLTKFILSHFKLPKITLVCLGFAICIAYLFSVSTQGMLTDEFHNDPIAALPLLLLLYALFTKKQKLYWISFIWLLLTKETYGLLAVPIGLYIAFTTKQFKKAFLTAGIGFITFITLIYFVMPKFSPTGVYFHYADGNRPSDVIGEIIKNPVVAVTEFVDTEDKRITILVSLLSFGFLPVFGGIHLLLPFAALALRFYDDTTPLLYRFNNHYASPLIPFLAVSTIFGIKRILKLGFWKLDKKYKAILVAGFLLLVTGYQTVEFNGAVNSIFKPSFYQTQSWENDANDLIALIPGKASASANNALLAHLSERESLYLFPKYGSAEYIALDLSEGPNKFAPLPSSIEAEKKMQEIITEGNYQIIWKQNKAVLLKKLIK